MSRTTQSKQYINKSISMSCGGYRRYTIAWKNGQEAASIASYLGWQQCPNLHKVSLAWPLTSLPNIGAIFLEALRTSTTVSSPEHLTEVGTPREDKQIREARNTMSERFCPMWVHSQRPAFALTLLDLLTSTVAPTHFISDTVIPIYSQVLVFNFTCATLPTLA